MCNILSVRYVLVSEFELGFAMMVSSTVMTLNRRKLSAAVL